jgi:hypothetical protein
MRKAEAMQAWANAQQLADTIMKGFETQGIVPPVAVPDSDDEFAKAALREACVIAFGPSDRRTKWMAANTVLKFTKAPPAHPYATALTAAEEWLRQVKSDCL